MDNLTISISQLWGVSGVLASLISMMIGALWAICFNRIKEGQKLEFQRQLEKLKTKNDKCNYVSKNQFDTEFKIYQELSEPVFDMFFDVVKLFPQGIDYVPEDETECQNFYKQRYDKAMENLLKFQKKLYMFAPFIPKKIYKMYNEFRIEARKQVHWYPDFVLNPYPETGQAIADEKKACWERTKILMEKYDEITDNLREYLQSLRVQED